MNPCTWATAYSSKDNEDFKCAIQDMQVRKIETIFETQAQISNLTHRDHEINGLERSIGLDKWSLEQ